VWKSAGTSGEDIRNYNRSPKQFRREVIPMFLAGLFSFLAGFLALMPPGFYGYGKELVEMGSPIFPLVFLTAVIATIGGAIIMLASSCDTE